jgi:ABC-2 type transport system ATP-binding protein
MDTRPVIEVHELCKSYGGKQVVDHLSFVVQPGKVTGFLGPNGAGKSTTLRMIVGLDHPSSGTATIDGKPYAAMGEPLRRVGALLDAGAVHPGRSAYHHLLYLAQTQRLPRRRVDEVLDLVGLHDVARDRAGAFSLGMGQRLGLAVALLADPQVLVLDEPVNGLDPDGIFWIRTLMRQLATEGRTVLVSSHLMSEMSVTADHLIVIAQGRLIADCTTAEFIERHSHKSVFVRASDPALLRDLLRAQGADVGAADGDALIARGLEAHAIGALAYREGIIVFELTPQLTSLEDAFREQTHDRLDFGGRPLELAQPS